MTQACVGCGGEVPPRTRPGGVPKKFCSRRCGDTHQRKMWRMVPANREKDRAADARYYALNAERIRKRERDKYAAYPAQKYHQRNKSYGDPHISTENMHKDRYRAARAEGYRSGLEVAAARQLTEAGVEFQYEPLRIPYQIEETRHYVPDFILPNGIILELKGRWLTPDRKRHRLLHSQYPDLDVRFVFSRPQERISKQSRTTYARFCETQGWKYGGPLVPVEWLRERVNVRSLRAIERLLAG